MLGLTQLLIQQSKEGRGQLPALDFDRCPAVYFGTSEGLAALPQTRRHADGRPGETRCDVTVRAIAPGRVAHKRTGPGRHSVPYRRTSAAHETQRSPAQR